MGPKWRTMEMKHLPTAVKGPVAASAALREMDVGSRLGGVTAQLTISTKCDSVANKWVDRRYYLVSLAMEIAITCSQRTPGQSLRAARGPQDSH